MGIMPAEAADKARTADAHLSMVGFALTAAAAGAVVVIFMAEIFALAWWWIFVPVALSLVGMVMTDRARRRSEARLAEITAELERIKQVRKSLGMHVFN